MDVILLRKNRMDAANRLTLNGFTAAALALAIFGLMPLLALYAGYHWGANRAELSPEQVAAALHAELAEQRAQVEEVRRVAQENVNALARRLGQMQAHVIRLDALGHHLTQAAQLDGGEFDFENPPGIGGPESTIAEAIPPHDFMKMLDDLALQIEDRSVQLGVLENLIMNRNLMAEVLPAGRPITSGWMSSSYGTRTDPFSGRRVYHNGVDFAGKEGSDVVALGSGVVTFAGRRGGYGKLVEINHGNGYVTRYAHHKEILVEVGETVKRGQVIALLGSTGRSTGPHVHLEVLRDGKVVNPIQYVRASR
ncbi:M23 family metallopeptidase [Ectothiorhodospiraceae bacterium 2226]|nr:M23 family metallopeptidase [Ectothiorhodospiraceae bacterium 2226]